MTKKKEIVRIKTVVSNRKPKKEIHTDDMKVGQLKTIIMPNDGDASSIIREPDHSIDVIDGPTASDYAAELAFMEEPVTITVAETTDTNAIPVPGVWVNGRSQYFIRGVAVTVRRKFVEGLVRAKPINVKTKVSQAGAGEEPVNAIIRTSALLYPFTVNEDKNPRGADWLRKILAEV